MPLTDSAIRSAKPGAKPMKMTDAAGMYLSLQPTGARWWRLDYRINGKRKTLSLGTYPKVSLKEARDRRDEARKLVANGVDPSQARRTAKNQGSVEAANTFEAVAIEWMVKMGGQWAPSHYSKVLLRLKNDVFPWIGASPIAAIQATDLRRVLDRIQERGALDTAHRCLQTCSQIYGYAIATDRTQFNPCPSLKASLTPAVRKHFPTLVDPTAVGTLLRTLDTYMQGSPLTRAALKLAPLVFLRPGELRSAEWAHIDLSTGLMSIPGNKMKMGQPLIVPLSKQAVTVLEELRPLTGKGKYVFPCARSASRPMSSGTIGAAMQRMGIPKDEMSPHGFRAMARTILDEGLNIRPDFVEHQLAHSVKDPNGRAYNRTSFLAERRQMMQDWADHLDALKSGKPKVAQSRAKNRRPAETAVRRLRPYETRT